MKTPALEAIHRFLQLYRYLRHYSRTIHSQGIRGRELATLRYLMNVGPLRIGHICEYLNISCSSTSELVSRMEDAGYVRRRRCTKDNRVVYVELTDEGRALAEETPLGGIPLLRERLKAAPPDQLARINQGLTDLLHIMEIDDA